MSDDEKRECPFKKGDLVRHKASGEKAVVTDIIVTCLTHSALQHAQQMLSGAKLQEPCRYEYRGTVEIDTGFAADKIEIEDSILELCPQES